MSIDSRTIKIKGITVHKKSYYDELLRTTGRDGKQEQVDMLISRIQDDREAILIRARSLDGIGTLIPRSVRFRSLLNEAFRVYQLGNYYSTISLCGTIAELICYDYLDSVEISVDKMQLDDDAKDAFYSTPFRKLLTLLTKTEFLTKSQEDKLHAIYDMRNDYVHAKKKATDAEKDAQLILNRLSAVLEELFSIERFFDLGDDGKYHFKPNVKAVVDPPIEIGAIDIDMEDLTNTENSTRV